MKKITMAISLIIGFGCQHLHAQQSVNFGDFAKPVPSVSSLATYTNTPISNATGLPDISFPLVSLPSYNSAVSLNAGLSYNPMNVSDTEPSSQVGRGWSLFAGGVISRSIENDIDELYDNAASNDYYKNSFDDTYYYNLPGISGKFKFVRDTQNNTFRLVNLTANKVKIEYTRTGNTATLIVDSFTITDNKGIRYIFNDYSRNNQERNVYLSSGKVYRSAFFLTQIRDANNVELANFTYQKDVKYKNTGTVSYETCKLKTIAAPGFGTIEFEYSYDAGLENAMADPYQLQKVLLKDLYGHLISGYSFDYQVMGYSRMLNGIKKLNRNNAVSENTRFEYGYAAHNAPPVVSGTDPDALCPGLYAGFPVIGEREILKKVINPSGGVVEYNFEQNLKYKNRSEPAYVNEILSGNTFSDPEVQYINQFWGVDYDTHQSNNTNYTFTITGNPGSTKKVLVTFIAEELYTDSQVWDPSVPYSMGYTIKSGGTVVGGNPCQSPNSSGEYYTSQYDLLPGTYQLQVGGSGGKGGVYFNEIAHIPQPFKNTTRGIGVRIQSIKYYNSTADQAPARTTRFEYSSFTDPDTSSGYDVIPDTEDPNASSYIIYKNVKVSDADDGKGYVKYYYKIPEDFPKQSYTQDGWTGAFWPYYNMISSGLQYKKEVYNAQNTLLVSDETDYQFDNVPGSENYQGSNYSKMGWTKKLVSTSKNYFDNGQSVTESSETYFSPFNFEVARTSRTTGGNTLEQFFTYPETGYSSLAGANIISTPVIVESKTDGETTSKTETRFDNAGSVLPTAIKVSAIGGNASKTSTISLYDNKGNVNEFTSPAGLVTAVVYGYSQTRPIARVEGAHYSDVAPYVQSIIDASNADAADPSAEPALLTALDNFRKTDALKNFRITTYTYDPLIGATTVTPPAGIREVYSYDAEGRLQKVVDMNGATLKEYQYNYKN